LPIKQIVYRRLVLKIVKIMKNRNRNWTARVENPKPFFEIHVAHGYVMSVEKQMSFFAQWPAPPKI